VHALVLLEPTQVVKTSTAAIKLAPQRLAADEVPSTM